MNNSSFTFSQVANIHGDLMDVWMDSSSVRTEELDRVLAEMLQAIADRELAERLQEEEDAKKVEEEKD